VSGPVNSKSVSIRTAEKHLNKAWADALAAQKHVNSLQKNINALLVSNGYKSTVKTVNANIPSLVNSAKKRNMGAHNLANHEEHLDKQIHLLVTGQIDSIKPYVPVTSLKAPKPTPMSGIYGKATKAVKSVYGGIRAGGKVINRWYMSDSLAAQSFRHALRGTGGYVTLAAGIVLIGVTAAAVGVAVGVVAGPVVAVGVAIGVGVGLIWYKGPSIYEGLLRMLSEKDASSLKSTVNSWGAYIPGGKTIAKWDNDLRTSLETAEFIVDLAESMGRAKVATNIAINEIVGKCMGMPDIAEDIAYLADGIFDFAGAATP